MIRTDLFIGYQAGIYFEADIVFLFFLFFYRMPSYTTTCVEKNVSHIYWKFSIMSCHQVYGDIPDDVRPG